MAITLTVDSLMYPLGELSKTMFPDGDQASVVELWLDEAKTKCDTDDAARHWVYYRAYTAASLRVALLPTTDQRFDVSTTWGKDRVDFFNKKANEHLAEFNRLTETEAFTDLKPAQMAVY